MAAHASHAAFKGWLSISEAPLYCMLGIACGLAVYTPIRHLFTAPDIMLDHREDYFADSVKTNPAVLKRGLEYHGGILGNLSNVRHGGLGSVLPDVGVPATYNPRDGFHARSTIPRPE